MVGLGNGVVLMGSLVYRNHCMMHDSVTSHFGNLMLQQEDNG